MTEEERWQSIKDAWAKGEPTLDQAGKPALAVRMPAWFDDEVLDKELADIDFPIPPSPSRLAAAMLRALDSADGLEEALDVNDACDEEVRDSFGAVDLGYVPPSPEERTRRVAESLRSLVSSFGERKVVAALFRAIAAHKSAE